MKLARSVLGGVIGFVVFICLLCAAAIIVDERCSMNLSADECAGMVQKVETPVGTNEGSI